MTRARVFVTGMGAITGAGLGVAPLWEASRSGRSAVGKADYSRPGPHHIDIAAQIKGFVPEDHIEASVLPSCDRFAQLAIVAGDEALAQAGLPRAHDRPERTGVIVGTGIGGLLTVEEAMHGYYALDVQAPHPFTIPRAMVSSAASHLSMRYGVTGPTFAMSSACSSAAQAIGMAAFLIRSGVIDRAIVGGSEALLSAVVVRSWEMLRVLTPDACRPFSKGRNGMVLGEAAAILVLESEAVASARGAKPLAELAGYGTTSDAGDIVRSDHRIAAAAMQQAIDDAGLAADDIDYVNAHGTGTLANDLTETEALRAVFGDRLPALPVSSTKPIHGHTIGAAGAVELIVTIMAMRDGVAPPTVNWLEADPKCEGLDPVPNTARSTPIRTALSNSFAFGGINACLVVVRSP